MLGIITASKGREGSRERGEVPQGYKEGPHIEGRFEGPARGEKARKEIGAQGGE